MNSLSHSQDRSPGPSGLPEAEPRDRPVEGWGPRTGGAAGEGEDAEVILKGSVISALGKLGRLARSLHAIVITRLVGAEVFGLYTLGWSLIDLVSKFGLFGLDRGVVRFVSQRHSDGDAEGAHRTVGQALGLGLAASVLVTAGLWVAAPGVAASFFHQPDLPSVLRILALSIPLLVVSAILLAALRAVQIVKFDAYVKSIAEPLVLLASAVALCALGWTVPGLAFAYLISAAGGLLFAARFFGRVFSPSRCISEMGGVSLRSPLTKFSTPILLDDALYTLMSRSSLFVLAMFLPAASVGIYAATSEAAGAVKHIRQAVDPIFAPVASGLVHQKEKERLSVLFASVTRWVLTLELIFLLGVGLWGGALLSVFGPAFTAGFWSLALLSCGYAVNGAFGAAEAILLADGRPGLNLLNSVFFGIVNVGLHLLLIPVYGISGAALATAVSLTLTCFLRIAEVGVLLGIHPFRRSLLKPVAAATLAFAAGLSLMQFGSFWTALSVLSLPLYLGLLGAFGMEAEDRALFERLRDRIPFRRRGSSSVEPPRSGRESVSVQSP